MKLQDIRDGKIVVTGQTSITHNGTVYRGKKQIAELIDRVLPVEALPKVKEVTKKPAKRVYKSKSEKKRIEAQIVEPTDAEIKEASEVEGADRYDESGDE